MKKTLLTFGIGLMGLVSFVGIKSIDEYNRGIINNTPLEYSLKNIDLEKVDWNNLKQIYRIENYNIYFNKSTNQYYVFDNLTLEYYEIPWIDNARLIGYDEEVGYLHFAQGSNLLNTDNHLWFNLESKSWKVAKGNINYNNTISYSCDDYANIGANKRWRVDIFKNGKKIKELFLDGQSSSAPTITAEFNEEWMLLKAQASYYEPSYFEYNLSGTSNVYDGYPAQDMDRPEYRENNLTYIENFSSENSNWVKIGENKFNYDYASNINNDYYFESSKIMIENNNEISLYEKNASEDYFQSVTFVSENSISDALETNLGFWVKDEANNLNYYSSIFSKNNSPSTFNFYDEHTNVENIIAGGDNWIIYENIDGTISREIYNFNVENISNYFYEDGMFYINDCDWNINIENENIDQVKINNEIIASNTEGHWNISMTDFINQEKWDDGKEQDIEISLVSNSVEISETIVLVNPRNLNLEIDRKDGSLIDIDPEVYYDESYSSNDGLIDGYCDENIKTLQIDDFYVYEIKVNGTPISNDDLIAIKNGTYELNNDIPTNSITIIDKFGKEWHYRIYNNDEKPKYWYETEQGIKNSVKAEAFGYDWENANAYESREIIDIVETSFDLAELDTNNSWNNIWDEYQENMYGDTLNGLGHRIPINTYTVDESIVGLDWNGEDNLSFREWYERWMVDSINDYYSMDLQYGDIEFIFEDNKVQNNEKELNLDNQMGYFSATDQGIDLGRVFGSSTSYATSYLGFESFDLGFTADEEFNSIFDDNLVNVGFDDVKRDLTFGEVKLYLDNIYISSIEEYSQDYGGDGFDFSIIEFKASDLNLIYYDQDGKVIKGDQLMIDVESISIYAEPIDESSTIFTNSATTDTHNLNINFEMPPAHKINKKESIIIYCTIFLSLMLMILTFIFIAFFKKAKYNKDLKRRTERNRELIKDNKFIQRIMRDRDAEKAKKAKYKDK